MSDTNSLGQPVGDPLPDWTPRRVPEPAPLYGRWCRLEPLSAARHADALFDANAADRDGAMWTYMPYGPFPDRERYRAWAADAAAGDDPLFVTVIPAAVGTPAGVAAFMRITPAHGVLEIGNIAFAPLLQGSAAATEAMSLMLGHAFDALGYRRVEWKCDALNAASRRAALRLGFSFEGVFRRHMVVKGRNRDTAWYAITDTDWPGLRDAHTRWLDPANFDAAGHQRTRLSDLTASA
ncbi:Protein N-acetyltransferase, RimJ/RimL family [Limimonas halophila]|uniref:Protein N-acetyltransferase, RimJ/RimL family n=1 Tax=Limimonas halophila TaxID=1082479 RepID=A0A1G7SRV6_9PROT|nr:GNAT family protein [Limimonas halophila]SDG25010.1 Protein N-acetyltransferase, RimJ/RimL family [Limimonas halophila]